MFCIVKFMSEETWFSGFFFFFWLASFELLLWAEQLLRTLSHSVFRPLGHSRHLSISLVTFFFLTSLFLFLLQQYTVPDIHSLPFGHSYLFSSAFPSSIITYTLLCFSFRHVWAHLQPFQFSLDKEKMPQSSCCIQLLFAIPLLHPLEAFTSKGLILSIFTHGCNPNNSNNFTYKVTDENPTHCLES